LKTQIKYTQNSLYPDPNRGKRWYVI